MKRIVVALYRVRFPLFYCAGAALVANNLVGSRLPGVLATRICALLALLTMILVLALVTLGPRHLPTHPTTVVAPPVRGRWLALNSPATKVPSHGVRAYGQAFAVDLVHEPTDGARPAFGGTAMRANGQYPAFGQPVFAMIDGTVVKASGWRRDHRARSNTLAVILMMIEGSVRELGGPGFIIGNHVTIRSDDGVFATVAHLQRGSVRVRVGDTVRAGEQIGRCGNSGNSSEPHVHAQLMDRASPWTGQGLPLAFAGITLDDESAPGDAVPRNDQHMSTV